MLPNYFIKSEHFRVFTLSYFLQLEPNMSSGFGYICMMNFELEAQDQRARTGTLYTDHGEIRTPIFMPVGTVGTVKGVSQSQLSEEIKAQIILGNTYHLYLRPGLDIIGEAGGLHDFMHWEAPILTDSGGYQIFSLSNQRKLGEKGATFKSHIDGSTHLFTPENVIDIQRTIGADIIMAFDECPPYPCEKKYAEKSMHLTHRWLQRCIEAMRSTSPKYGHSQSLFPIVQGSVYKDLRIKSAEYIAEQDLDGNAIGGLSVGEPAEDMYAMTELVCDILPAAKPRYLMGVGTPANLLECIALGIDMFDCVMPSRNGRNGMLFTWEGIINIKNKKWATDFSPIAPSASNPTSTFYTRAYLRHLIQARELLGLQIASIHNLSFYLELVTVARQQIQEGNFYAWKDEIIPKISRRL